MSLRILPTPLAADGAGDLDAVWRAQAGRRVAAPAAAALLAHGPAEANRQRLLAGGCHAVTTGQQAGLFSGPLYTVYKGLAAAALAAELEAARGTPVVPVFWVAGDDHDFAEVNHCSVIGADGHLARVTLRERAADEPMRPMFREPVGTDGAAALQTLAAALPPSDFREATLDWLSRAYRPEHSLAEACALALAELLGPYGVVVCRGWHPTLKQAARDVLLGALDAAAALDADLEAEAARLRAAGRDVTVPVGEGLSLVMVEGRLGRDRLRALEPGRFEARRSGEVFLLDDLRRLVDAEPERLSANVLLRPAVEAAVLPTVAYLGGPGELAYLWQTAPVFSRLGVPRPVRVPRFSALLVEAKVDKVLERHRLVAADLARPEGELAGIVAREELPPDALGALAALRRAVETHYADVLGHAVAVDKTLQKPVEGARNQALAGTHDVEKKLVSHLKRQAETSLQQVARARTQLFPDGRPQERVITAASLLSRHGTAMLDPLFEAAREDARRHLVAPLAGS